MFRVYSWLRVTHRVVHKRCREKTEPHRRVTPIINNSDRRGMKKKYYKQYIKSNDWKTFSSTIKSVLPMCLVCGNSKKITTHHISYKNKGRESIGQVAVLCWHCHHNLHQELKKRNMSVNDSFLIMREMATQIQQEQEYEQRAKILYSFSTKTIRRTYQKKW